MAEDDFHVVPKQRRPSATWRPVDGGIGRGDLEPAPPDTDGPFDYGDSFGLFQNSEEEEEEAEEGPRESEVPRPDPIDEDQDVAQLVAGRRLEYPPVLFAHYKIRTLSGNFIMQLSDAIVQRSSQRLVGHLQDRCGGSMGAAPELTYHWLYLLKSLKIFSREASGQVSEHPG